MQITGSEQIEPNVDGNPDGQGREEKCPVCQGESRGSRRVVRAEEVAICGSCGCWYRIPRPTKADLEGLYEKEYYDSWGLDEDESIAQASKRATFAPVLRCVEEMLGKAAEGSPRILDVGAATGLLLETARDRGWDPHAVELNPYAAGQLRERLGAGNVFEGELTDCAFEAASFDAVTMTDLIEHVLDVQATLQTAHRLLRDGGVLCITTPRVDSLSRKLMGANWLHFKLEHIQYFTRKGIELALGRAGFRDIRVSSSPKYLTLDYLNLQLRTYPHGILSPIIRVLHRLTPSALRSRPLRYLCGEMRIIARA